MATNKQSMAAAPTFSKAQLLISEKYQGRRDLLAALLEDGKTYTTAQADAAIDNYMKGKVR